MTENHLITTLQSQIEELQVQQAFQEDTIASLNDALAMQQRDLDWIKSQWEQLREQYARLQEQVGGGDGGDAEERPPHY